jgi:hypothetical protein
MSSYRQILYHIVFRTKNSVYFNKEVPHLSIEKYTT